MLVKNTDQPIFKGSRAKHTKIYKLVTIIMPKSATANKLHNKTNTAEEDTYFKDHISHHFDFFALWCVSNVPHYLLTKKTPKQTRNQKNLQNSCFGIVSFLTKKLHFFVPMKSFQDDDTYCKMNRELKKRKRKKNQFCSSCVSQLASLQFLERRSSRSFVKWKGFIQKGIYLLWHSQEVAFVLHTTQNSSGVSLLI